LVRAFPPGPGSPTLWTMSQFIQASVIWAIFNLLPILPLDGGQMMLAAIEGLRRKPSVAIASWISAVLCVVVGALVTLQFGLAPFTLLFLLLFTFQNVQRARAASQVQTQVPQTTPMDVTERLDIESATAEVREIGRASCRERVEMSGGGVCWKRK